MSPRWGRRRGRNTSANAGVPARGTIVLSASTVSLTQSAGSATTVTGQVSVGNSGAGSFAGIHLGAISYVSGSGWLTASVVPGFPAAVTVTASSALLSAGTYTATIPVQDANTTNSPQTLTVSFVVTAVAVPSLVLSNPTMTLSVQQGNAATVTATCLVTSGTAAALGTLSIGTITGTGATGITASVAGNLVTVTGASAALTNASSPYTATVPVVDATASNTPQNITVTLNVAAVSPPPTPTMALSASSVTLNATAGSGQVVSTTITVTSSNGAALGTTDVGTITGTATSALSTSVADNTVTITAAVGSLAAATYTATVPILDSQASNSPQNVTVSFVVAASPVPSSSIPAEIQLFGSTAGQGVLVSRAFPLRPGDLSDAQVAARAFRVLISGAEVPIYAEALRGRHADGSVRAMLVQLAADIPDTTPIVAEVQIGVTRTTTDRVKVPVTQDVVWNLGVTPYSTKAALLPTSPAYLCATLAAGSPLVPATQVDAVSYPLFLAYMDNRFEALKNSEQTSTTAQSDYEHVRGLVAAWCMTGLTKYYTQAMSRARYLWTYTSDTIPPAFNPTFNLEGISGGSGLLGAESKTQRHWTWFVGYYTTGWPSFYATANAGGQQGMRSGNALAQGYARMSSNPIYLTPRFNCRTTPYVWVSALMDATRTMSSPSGPGVNAAGQAQELYDILTDVIGDAYVETHGGTGWRTGFPWVNSGVDVRGSDASAQVGDWPWFQSALAARHLVDYYLMVGADSRIPPLVKFMVDAMVAQWKTSSGGAYSKGSDITSATLGGTLYTFDEPMYGVPYLTRGDPANNGGMYAWLQPLWAPAVAFVHAYYGGNDPTGTPYATHYRRVVNPRLVYHTGSNSSGLTWNWKIWGEVFGGNFVAAYLMSLTGPPTGPAAIRTPTLYTTWPD